MISKTLIEFIFEAAHIERWNDHMRTSGFTELDKQAHKMIIAYILGKAEEGEGNKIDWLSLIEGSIFEFFHRIVLTDIKPPIFNYLNAEHSEKLNEWIFKNIKKNISCLGSDFENKMHIYFDCTKPSTIEKDVLRAAHFLATDYEFKMIYPLNINFVGIEDTKKEILNAVASFYHLASVKRVRLDSNLKQFIDLCGQLRFQKRWANTPRIPQTSVLGHMYVVAMLSYFFTSTSNFTAERISNNFLCALFHDLPEVLTRDIVSPIKKSVAGLEEVIKKIEEKQLNEKIKPLLPEEWYEELVYFTKDEFKNKYINQKNEIVFIEEDELGQFVDGRFKVIDGTLLKCCDNLSAMLEAVLSIKHGVSSKSLSTAVQELNNKYHDVTVEGIDFGKMFDQFFQDTKLC